MDCYNVYFPPWMTCTVHMIWKEPALNVRVGSVEFWPEHSAQTYFFCSSLNFFPPFLSSRMIAKPLLPYMYINPYMKRRVDNYFLGSRCSFNGQVLFAIAGFRKVKNMKSLEVVLRWHSFFVMFRTLSEWLHHLCKHLFPEMNPAKTRK